MRTFVLTVLLTASTVNLFLSAQQQPAEDAQREKDLSARVGALVERLNYRDDDPTDKDRYYDQLDNVTRELQERVDDYIRGVITTKDDSSRIEAKLNDLLRRHPDPSYGDGPLARKAELRAGKYLLLAYTVVRPPHHDVATIRGYVETPDGYKRTATTGEDFDGFNMFKKELRSPLLGEIWLMAWGESHTGNGKIVRFRLYAFDGEVFRTLWSPEEMFNAELRFTDSGFTIDHYHRPRSVHDEYLLTTSGPLKVTP